MAARRKGSFDMDAAIELKLSTSLDARQHVRNKSERLDPDSFNPLHVFKGMITASGDEEKLFFLLDRNNPQLEESWMEIGPYDDTEVRNLITQVDNRITDQTITGGTGISVVKNGDNYVITNTGSSGEDKVFIAEYDVTSAQEIIEYMGSESFAPIIVKRGNEYHTTILSFQRSDNSVLLRTTGSNSGDYYIFNYTVTDTTWASSSYGLQKKLVSGSDIKTINGQNILGGGDISINENEFIANEGSGVFIANEGGNAEHYFASTTTGVDVVTPNKVVATHYIPSGSNYTETTTKKTTITFGNGLNSSIEGTEDNMVITVTASTSSETTLVAGSNVSIADSGTGGNHIYTINVDDADTKTVLTAGDNVTITDNGTGGDHNYRIDVADAGPDDYMVYSKNPNIIITAMGDDQEENIFLYDASIAGATADNNQLSDFETGTDKIEIKGTSLSKGQLTQFATQGAGIYYSNGILSYNDGTNVKTIVKVVDGSIVAAADVTII